MARFRSPIFKARSDLPTLVAEVTLYGKSRLIAKGPRPPRTIGRLKCRGQEGHCLHFGCPRLQRSIRIRQDSHVGRPQRTALRKPRADTTPRNPCSGNPGTKGGPAGTEQLVLLRNGPSEQTGRPETKTGTNETAIASDGSRHRGGLPRRHCAEKRSRSDTSIQLRPLLRQLASDLPRRPASPVRFFELKLITGRSAELFRDSFSGPCQAWSSGRGFLGSKYRRGWGPD